MDKKNPYTKFRLPLQVLLDYVDNELSDLEIHIVEEYLEENPDELLVIEGARRFYQEEMTDRAGLDSYIRAQSKKTDFLFENLEERKEKGGTPILLLGRTETYLNRFRLVKSSLSGIASHALSSVASIVALLFLCISVSSPDNALVDKLANAEEAIEDTLKQEFIIKNQYAAFSDYSFKNRGGDYLCGPGDDYTFADTSMVNQSYPVANSKTNELNNPVKASRPLVNLSLNSVAQPTLYQKELLAPDKETKRDSILTWKNNHWKPESYMDKIAALQIDSVRVKQAFRKIHTTDKEEYELTIAADEYMHKEEGYLDNYYNNTETRDSALGLIDIGYTYALGSTFYMQRIREEFKNSTTEEKIPLVITRFLVSDPSADKDVGDMITSLLAYKLKETDKLEVCKLVNHEYSTNYHFTEEMNDFRLIEHRPPPRKLILAGEIRKVTMVKSKLNLEVELKIVDMEAGELMWSKEIYVKAKSDLNKEKVPSLSRVKAAYVEGGTEQADQSLFDRGVLEKGAADLRNAVIKAIDKKIDVP